MLHERMIMDQADGLRRLLLGPSTQVVCVAAAQPGFGVTSVTVNLASALARAGKDVLILDENLSHDNVGNMLALKPRYDLLNAVRGDFAVREVMLRMPQGVRVLPMARAMRALPQLEAAERDRLPSCLEEASRGMDVVLVDAVSGRHGISSSLATEQPLLLVLNATAASITESYALIKRMALEDGRRTFEVVVNRARDEREAQTVFGNVAEVARRHLRVRVEYLGYIPVDERLKRATQLCRTVVETFPEAGAARAFTDLSANLMSLACPAGGETGGLPDVIQRLMRQARAPAMAQNPI